MRINELINEAGLIGKLGSAVGKAATGQGLAKAAGMAAGIGQKFAQGANKWKGTGFGMKSNNQTDSGGSDEKALPGNVDPTELRNLLTAVVNGQQLSPDQLKTAEKVKNAV